MNYNNNYYPNRCAYNNYVIPNNYQINPYKTNICYTNNKERINGVGGFLVPFGLGFLTAPLFYGPRPNTPRPYYNNYYNQYPYY